MSILLTRPYHLAVNSQNNIKRLGKRSIIVPLIEVKNLSVKLIDNKYNSIILTSQNAIPTLKQNLWIKNKAIFTVGKKTSDILFKNGFYNITFRSNVFNLEKAIVNNITTSKKLLYVSGDNLFYNLESSLKKKGYDITTQVVYNTIAKEVLLKKQIEEINTSVTSVIFYSARTSDIFSKIALQHKLDLSNKEAICISKTCVVHLLRLNWKRIKVASEPNEAAIFKLL